jgi:hypothetical protein
VPILVFIYTIAPPLAGIISAYIVESESEQRINFAFGLISSHPSNTCVSNMKSKKKGMTTSYDLY